MALYARRPWRFLGQLSMDLFVLIWGTCWWFISRFVDGAIRTVAEPARQAGQSAESLAEDFRRGAEQAGRIPAVGEGLRKPFDAAADSLGSLVTSAADQVASLERLALLIGWLVFLVPVSIMVAIWLPQRIRFFLRARAAQRFIDSSADLTLFALRAMASQPMHVIAKISDDPVAAWRSGDRKVIDQLAEVELRRSGLRMPARQALAPEDGSSQG